MDETASTRVRFLGNVGRIDGRPSHSWVFGDPPYRRGDRLVEVWSVSVDAEPNDTPESLAELLWVLMNADDRPTGRYFRSMCVGDVALVGDGLDAVALVCCSAGFERLETVPPYESGLSEERLLVLARCW